MASSACPVPPVQFQGFTLRALRALATAHDFAKRNNLQEIDAEYILIGFLDEGSGVGANALRQLEIEPTELMDALVAGLDDTGGQQLLLPQSFDWSWASGALHGIASADDDESATKTRLTARAQRVIDSAKEESQSLDQNYVGSEHLILGMLHLHDGIGPDLLRDKGLHDGRIDEVRRAVREILG